MAQRDEVVGAALERCTQTLRQFGLENAALEARLLLEHVTGQSRASMLAHPEAMLEPSAAHALALLVDRRTAGEPIAYLLRKREFFGLQYFVDPRVLVPRPETEVVVSEALEIASDRSTDIHIVDVGTGSGAIALALATHLPHARVTAVDVSRDALEVAALNALRLGVADRVELIQGDVISWLAKPVDLIVANLPYIPADSMVKLFPEVRDYEPHLALDGGLGGIELNNRLLQEIPTKLVPGGHLLMECEPHQMEALNVVTRTLMPGSEIDFVVDGFGHARVFHVTMPA
jgi:release factor glutamine methyltransferase